MKMKKFLFFLLFSLSFLYSNLVRISGVVILPPLAQSIGVSATMIGFLSSLFFYAYGISFVFWGVIIDRIGSFKTCGISLLIAAFASFILVSATTPLTIGLGRILSGFGLSSAFTGIMLYTSQSFTKERFSFLVGIIMMIGHSGTVIAVAPLGLMLDIIGARGVYLLFGFTALLISSLLLYFHEYDPLYKLSSHKIGEKAMLSISSIQADMLNGAKIICNNFHLMVIVFTWITSSASISTLQGLWAVSWIQAAIPEADIATARLCATWISIGMVAGPLFGGFIMQRVSQSKNIFLVMCIFTQVSWLTWMLVSMYNRTLSMFAISGFLIGFFSGLSFVYMGNSLRNLAPPNNIGAIIGLLNLGIYSLLIVFQWGTGFILDIFPQSSTAGNYSQSAYLLGFSIIILIQGYSYYLITKIKYDKQ